MNLDEAKVRAKCALDTLIGQCEREIRNIDRFDDQRMCVATADVQRMYGNVLIAAEQLEDACNEALEAREGVKG